MPNKQETLTQKTKTKTSKELREEAHKVYLKTTRKIPNSPHRTAKSEKELEREIFVRKINQAKGPKCFKTPIPIDEKKRHNGAPCPKGQERTKNFCVKPLLQTQPDNKKMSPTEYRWFRVLTPNKNTRITLACPK